MAPKKLEQSSERGHPDRRRRGIRTRQQMLEVLNTLLATESIREIKVVNITGALGLTQAAFYQYFSDLKSAILALAEEMVASSMKLPSLFVGDWGSDGHILAQRVVDGFMEFWKEHEPVLRVVELALDEQDPAFDRIRSSMLSESHIALALVIANMQASGERKRDVDPKAMSAVIIASLLHVNARLGLYNRWGRIETIELRTGLVNMVYTMVTGRFPEIHDDSASTDAEPSLRA